MVSLEDKISGISLAVVTAATCAVGGFATGWYKAQGTEIQYEQLLKYGPTLFTASAFGAQGVVEAYSARKKSVEISPVISALGGAATGGFFGMYNTFFFFCVGYVAGKVTQ